MAVHLLPGEASQNLCCSPAGQATFCLHGHSSGAREGIVRPTSPHWPLLTYTSVPKHTVISGCQWSSIRCAHEPSTTISHESAAQPPRSIFQLRRHPELQITSDLGPLLAAGDLRHVGLGRRRRRLCGRRRHPRRPQRPQLVPPEEDRALQLA